MGRISSVGWAAGYVGGLVALGACATYMAWAQHNGQTPQDYVPTTMLMCAVYFGITVLPTLIWLKERAIPDPTVGHKRMISVSFERLGQTLRHARHYRDLFKFLITLFVYSCGTTTIVHMAAVYAQQVFHFAARDLVMMILCINVTAAVGAVVFGFVQDKIGSIKTLGLTLTIWLFAILLAVGANSTTSFWIAGNVVGIAMGASGSVGRALVAQFSPPGKSGEFLGLWGVAVKLATCVGALSFGFMTWITGSNYRLAMLSICAFFIGGIFLLSTVDEKRGRAAALTDVPNG